MIRKTLLLTIFTLFSAISFASVGYDWNLYDESYIGNFHKINETDPEPTYTGRTVFYVDSASTTSSDSNPGTAELPWKTLYKANQVVTSGTTIIIQSGNYEDPIAPPVDGTPEFPIIYTSDENDYIPRLKALTGIDLTNRKHIVVRRVNTFGNTKAVDLTNASNSMISDVIVENSSRYGVYLNGSSDIVMDNFLFDDYSTPSIHVHDEGGTSTKILMTNFSTESSNTPTTTPLTR